jgi:hypothetical protein
MSADTGDKQFISLTPCGNATYEVDNGNPLRYGRAGRGQQPRALWGNLHLLLQETSVLVQYTGLLCDSEQRSSAADREIWSHRVPSL